MEDDFYSNIENKLKKNVDSLVNEYRSIQVGEASPVILDKIKVDYYGSLAAIDQVATVSVVEARVLVISPWDVNLLKPIERAIQKANIGINPVNDGKVIRLVFPQPTGEHRKEIVKEVKAIYEKCKVSIKKVRQMALDYVKKIHKQGEISDDEEHYKKEKIQNLIDKYNNQIAGIFKKKEEEVESL